MTLPKTKSDREYEKFLDDVDLGTVVKTLTKIYGSISGSFAPTGLFTELKITTFEVTDTASLIPATNLADRNAMAIRNKSDTDTIYVGPNNSVTADAVVGTTSGWEVGPGEDFQLDVTDAIDIYAIAESGKTVLIKVMEIA